MPISSPYCMNYRVAVGLLAGQGYERSELPCLADGIIKLGRRPWSFYVYHICYLVDRRIRGQMLLMRNIVFGHSRPTSRLFERKKTKTFGLALFTYNLGRVSHRYSQSCPTNRLTATRYLSQRISLIPNSRRLYELFHFTSPLPIPPQIYKRRH